MKHLLSTGLQMKLKYYKCKLTGRSQKDVFEFCDIPEDVVSCKEDEGGRSLDYIYICKYEYTRGSTFLFDHYLAT